MCVSGVCIYIYVDGWKSRDRRVGVRGGGVYFVFHASCAALTLIWAVSAVKGG